MIAVVHLDPRLTVPVAFLVGAGLVWYWFSLGATGVPAGRRRIRRLSVLVMVLSLPHFVRGLSYLDPNVDQLDYLIAWSVALLAILLVFLTACIDALLTLRLLRRERQEIADRAVESVLGRRAAADDGDSPS